MRAFRPRNRQSSPILKSSMWTLPFPSALFSLPLLSMLQERPERDLHMSNIIKESLHKYYAKSLFADLIQLYSHSTDKYPSRYVVTLLETSIRNILLHNVCSTTSPSRLSAGRLSIPPHPYQPVDIRLSVPPHPHQPHLLLPRSTHFKSPYPYPQDLLQPRRRRDQSYRA
jgi:hypothetical protein